MKVVVDSLKGWRRGRLAIRACSVELPKLRFQLQNQIIHKRRGQTRRTRGTARRERRGDRGGVVEDHKLLDLGLEALQHFPWRGVLLLSGTVEQPRFCHFQIVREGKVSKGGMCKDRREHQLVRRGVLCKQQRAEDRVGRLLDEPKPPDHVEKTESKLDVLPSPPPLHHRARRLRHVGNDQTGNYTWDGSPGDLRDILVQHVQHVDQRVRVFGLHKPGKERDGSSMW